LDWLIAHNIELYISIDGTAEDHNRYRLYPNGKGSFEDVHRVLQYIRTSHCAFLDKVQLMMTLVSIDRLQYIAQLWNEDEILQHIQPAKISALAPNFARGVAKRDYDRLRETYSRMLDLYEQHPEWVVLKAFFEDCIAYWYQRPIMQADGAIPMATCMPQNNKLYIDANKNIGVCEKMPDTIRIGSVEQGIKWDEANRVVETYYNQRICRCATCPVVRMCDLCLTAVDYTEKQWDILCHNERVYTRVHMWVFCEMAERGLIK